MKRPESLVQTIQEAGMVQKEAGLARAIVVFHLTNCVRSSALPQTFEKKLELYQNAAGELGRLFADVESDCILAVENTYRRLDGSFADVGPFHPQDFLSMHDYGFKAALDLAHYQIYSNYMSLGEGNPIGDIDRKQYGQAPSWARCIETLGSSLALLHVTDAAALDISGRVSSLEKARSQSMTS